MAHPDPRDVSPRDLDDESDPHGAQARAQDAIEDLEQSRLAQSHLAEDLLSEDSSGTALPSGEVIHTTAGMPAVRAGRLRLTFESSSREGEVLTLAPGEHTVGRRSRNDVVLDGQGFEIVSGDHARLFVQGGVWWIDDLDSTNGTYVNGRKVRTSTRIRRGDLLEIGRPREQGRHPAIRVRVEVDDADDTAPDDRQPAEEATIQRTIASLSTGTQLTSNGTHEPPSEDTLRPITGETARPSRDVDLDVDPVNLREHLAAIQEKNRRLGGVTFQLDTHVRTMVETLVASLRDPADAPSVATSDEGQQLAGMVRERDQLELALASLEDEAPKLHARSEAEVAPLERAEDEAQQRSAAARTSWTEAETRTTDDREAFEGQLAKARASVEQALRATLDDGDSDRGAPQLDDAPAWTQWREALEASTRELDARTPSLEEAHARLRESTRAGEVARAASDDAERLVEEASRAVTERRREIEAAIAANAAETESTKERLETLRGGVEAKAEALVRDSLAGAGDATLTTLPSFDDASRLAGEAAAIEEELDELQARIAGR